ncbi:hypothetical protein GN956_G19625 [Arapaima gigas]
MAGQKTLLRRALFSRAGMNHLVEPTHLETRGRVKRSGGVIIWEGQRHHFVANSGAEIMQGYQLSSARLLYGSLKCLAALDQTPRAAGTQL